MRKKILIGFVVFAGCLVIAIPTGLFFGLGDLIFGGNTSSVIFTVVFITVGLAILWAAQFAWESWRDRDREGRN